MADKKAGTQAGANDLVLRMVKQATPAAMFKAPAKPSVPKTPGTFSSMAVPTEDIAKAQKPKPKKITPWEVRQDAVRVVGKASKLTTPEDYTLLDQFLYINRESKTGEKISPTQSKVTAPAFGVTQDAVNRARMLARTPEGRAKMAAEVAEFRQARAFASGVKDAVTHRGTSVPSLAPSTLSPAQSAQMADERARERSFETSTSGRMSKSLEGVKKEVQGQIDPVMKILGQVIANAVPLDVAKPALAEMLRTLPVEQIAAIPQGITDLLASVDQESQIDAGKRIQMALMGGLNLVGGMAGAAELGGAATASRGLLKYGDDAIGGMVSGAAALKAARLKKAADRAAQTQGMVNRATTGTSRPTVAAPNAVKPMGRFEPKPLPGYDEGAPIDLLKSPRLQPETPTIAPVAPPKAPKVKPAPVVAEKPPQAATQAIPESGANNESKELWEIHPTDDNIAAFFAKKVSEDIRRTVAEARNSLKPIDKELLKKNRKVLALLRTKGGAGLNEIRNGALSPDGRRDGTFDVIWDMMQKPEVLKAIKEGKPVPAEVLAAYPDLAPKVSTIPPVSTAGKVADAGKSQSKELAAMQKQGASMASDRAPFWQARAKQGGEYGPNGEWYPGGKFIATAPETVKGQFRKIKAAGEARLKSSLPLNETQIEAPGAGGVTRPADKARWYNGPIELNSDLRKIGDRVITPDDNRRTNEAVAWWNDLVRRVDNGEPGFRWKNEKGEGVLYVDTNLHPEFTSYGQIARYIAKGELIPDALVPKAKELIDGLDIDRYQELVKWNAGRGKPLSETSPYLRTPEARLETAKRPSVTSGSAPHTVEPAAPTSKPTPADAAARADASFRAKHGVGVGDEVTVTYPNGKVQEGTLEHTAKTGWKIGNESVTPKTMTSIKPKAQAVEPVPPTAPVSPKVELSAKPTPFAEDDIVRTADGKLAQVMGTNKDGTIKLLERDEVTGALGKELTAPASSLRKSANTMDDIRALEADVRLPGGKFDDVRKQLGTPALKKLAPDTGTPKVETPAIPETPTPTTGMEGLADRLAERKAKLQDELAKAPKAIKGKQAGATFGPERLLKEVDLFLTSAAEAAVRKGISLRKAIQELVMAEGRDADDVAELNKALPKWADELGLDDEFINGAKATGKTADNDDFSLADAVTDRLMLDMGKMPTAAPAESVKSLFKKAEQAAKDNPSAIDAVIADANATGRRMDEYEIAQATYRGQGVYREIQAKANELQNPSLSKEARAVLEAQKDALESQLQDIAWSVQPAKTGFANVGKAFQIMLSPKYDFRSMADRGVAANLGRKLADVQMQTIRDLSDNVLSLESDAAKTKAALLKMDAEALVNQTPDIIKAEKDLLAAQERFNALKDNLTQIRKDKGSAQRKIRNAEKAIERAKTQLAEKSARLDSLIEDVPEKAKAARSRRSVSNDAKATKNRALSILKRFGLYSGEIESGAKAISGKQAGGFNADPKRIQAGIDKIKSWADFKDPESGDFVESAAQSAAGAVRSLMKLYLERQYALGRYSVPIEEALTATAKMTDGGMDEDFILGLISGKYRAQVLEANVAKLRGNAYINGIKQSAQWGEASPLEKAGLFAADAFSGVSRAMKMSVDLSFGGIQGFKALTGGYAPEWARAYGKAWKTVRGGERAYLTSMAELAKNPGYKRAVKAGVSFSDAHTIDHAEEAFQSTIIDALHKKFGGTAQGVPIEMIKRSEYFHSAFGNELRLAMFNKMDGGSAKTPQELENIADLVNIITWRGALKKGQKVNPIISHLLVTARGYLSQWQDVTLKPLRKAIVKGDSAGAERALKYYANRVAKLAGIGYLASFFGWEFDNDPRSGRVGWLRHPGMKIDLNLVGDELQWIRALVQGSYGTINTKGEVGRKPDTPLDPMFRTLGGKLTPGARIATEAMAGSFFDFNAQEEKKLSFKDPLGLAQWFAKQYVPISVGAGWETGKELIANPDKSAGAKKGAMTAGDLVGVRMSDAKNRATEPVKGFWNLETIGKHPLITGEGIPDIEGPKSGASKPKESSVSPYKSPRRAKGDGSFGKAFPP